MQYHELASPEELSDTINGFWYAKINFGELPSGFEVLPDGDVEIIFHFGSGCSIATNKGILQLPSPFMVGLLNQPIVLHAKKYLEVIGIKCYPWTVFDLLGLPSGNDGVRVFEHPIAKLQPTLQHYLEGRKIDEALAHVRQYFLDAKSRIAPDSMLFKAGVAMSKANGTMPVSQVAAAAHATVRTLERKFKQSSGHSVKDISGLMRFEKARNQLWGKPNYKMADLAYELGYTDQAHLSREFKRYSGITPTAFAQKARQGKRVAENDFVAFIQAFVAFVQE